MASQFRAVSLTSPQIYMGSKTDNSVSEPSLLHKIVRDSGFQSYHGIRIPVPANFYIANWRRFCRKLLGWLIGCLLEFVFPLNFDRKPSLSSVIYHKEHDM